MIETLLANEVFAGIIGAGFIGTIAYQFRAVLSLLKNVLVRRFTCEMTVHSDSVAFLYINEWITRRPEAARIRRAHLSEAHEGDRWAFSVGEGRHLFIQSRPFLLVTRIVQEGSNSLVTRQKLIIRTLGGGQKALRSIVSDAMKINEGDGHTEIYLWHAKGGYWNRIGKELSRRFSSIVLHGDQANRISRDALHFFSSSEWYAERGVPWRRGYLFHGPPGTGKSSTVRALAGDLGKNIYVVSLNSLQDDAGLLECVSCVPPDALLLMEDIDAALATRGREDSGEDSQPGISLAGLLNALDGVASGTGRLLVMTSNYPERLDAALIRPGRVDMREYFGMFGNDEIDKMVHRFHPGLRLLDLPRGLEVQPAELQDVLMSAPLDELEERIKRLRTTKEDE